MIARGIVDSWRVHLLLSETLLNTRIRYLVLSETTGFSCSGNASLFKTIRDPERRRYPLFKTIRDPERRNYPLFETVRPSDKRRFLLSRTMKPSGRRFFILSRTMRLSGARCFLLLKTAEDGYIFRTSSFESMARYP